MSSPLAQSVAAAATTTTTTTTRHVCHNHSVATTLHELHGTAKVRVYRFNPNAAAAVAATAESAPSTASSSPPASTDGDHDSLHPTMKEYTVDLGHVGGGMVLDALSHIKDKIDPSLSFRRACREGVCGSCAMNINGVNALACTKNLEDALRDGGGVVTVRPLPHMRVLKDLVVDMTHFFEQHASVMPWLQPNAKEERETKEKRVELRQTPEQRKRLDGLIDCVQCASCSASCPEYWWSEGKDQRFLGPSALQQAYRWIADSRDVHTADRLEALRHDPFRAYKCHTILNCTATCPKSLNPAEAVQKVKQLLVKKQPITTSPVLHDS